MRILNGMLDFFLSVRTSLWLLMAQLGLFLVGAFLMPTMPEYSTMNSTALFMWFKESPLGATWWLWASVAVLALLTLNTTACSVESILKKRRNRNWLLVISPQIIHIGFILMLFAHLLSASGSEKNLLPLREGMSVRLPDESTVTVKSLNVTIGPGGYPTDWRADIELGNGTEGQASDYLAPNRPSYKGGYWIYLKEVRPYPVKTGIFEINREPGAPWALAGGVLFTIGTVALVMLKIRREQ